MLFVVFTAVYFFVFMQGLKYLFRFVDLGIDIANAITVPCVFAIFILSIVLAQFTENKVREKIKNE